MYHVPKGSFKGHPVSVMHHQQFFNSLPNDRSKLKGFADDKIYVIQKLKFVLGRLENILVKGENAGYQHFLLFPQCFQKASYTGSLKVGIMW